VLQGNGGSYDRSMRWNLALAGLAASWGFIAVLAAAVDLGAEALAFLRLAIAAATLAAVALVARRSLRPGRALPGLVLLGIAQGAHWLLFFEAVKLGSVALAVLTFYTAPIVLALAAPLFLPERVRAISLAALGVGGVGILLVALGGDGEERFSLAAVSAGLGSAATYAALVVISKRLLLERVPPLTVAFWDCLVGAVAVAPVLLVAGRALPNGHGEWWAVLALGVVFTGISTLVYAALLRQVTAQTAGLLTFLEPVAAVVLAAVLLDESLFATTVAGGAVVLAAGLVVVLFEPAAAVTESAASVGSSPS
jgi:drug/metabolite transporter (DMT)-like permease